MGGADPQTGRALGRALRPGRSAAVVLRSLERAESAAFGSGKQSDYFKLYRYTAEAIKGVDTELKVGGPATAANAWIDDFMGFCKANSLPADFISTHHYPTDAFGKPGDDTETQLAKSRAACCASRHARCDRQAGDRPVYYTEWCTSSNPRDPMHDEPYAAAFIVKTILEANGLVQGYSYWTFSDIFEENYFPSVPFHGGFGLLNIHGIAKPAYRAFRIAARARHRNVAGRRHHATVDAWVVRGDAAFHAGAHQLRFAASSDRHGDRSHSRSNARQSATTASIRRIDLDHANAKRRWEQMG